MKLAKHQHLQTDIHSINLTDISKFW